MEIYKSNQNGFFYRIGNETARIYHKVVTEIEDNLITVWYVSFRRKRYRVSCVEAGVKLIKALAYVHHADEQNLKFKIEDNRDDEL